VDVLLVTPKRAIVTGSNRQNRAARLDQAWMAAVVLLCLALLVPPFVTEVPPLGDYPNHLARAFVLSRLPGDPVLARMYAARWSIIPNLGLDVVMPPLMRFLPVYWVGRVVIGAAAVLPVLGSIAYQRALTGARGESWWSLGAGLTLYGGCLVYGFLNFTLALGLALLLAAGWLAWRETRPVRTIALAAAGALVLFACHLMGLVFFGLLIGSAELAHLRASRPAEALRRGAVLALVIAAPAVLYAISALAGLGGDAIWMSPEQKFHQLATAFDGYNGWLDAASAALAFGVPAIALLLRRGRFPKPAAIAVLLLAGVYALAPYSWKGTYQLDTRLAVMLAFMMFAGFVPVGWPRWTRIGAASVIAGLFVVRLAVLITGWHAQTAVLASLRTAMAPLRPGQIVMVAEASPAEAPAYWDADPHWLRLSDGITLSANLGALVLIEHRAWWPFEFDNDSQQPIRTRLPYDALALRAAELPDRTRLLTMDLCGYDDVLVTNAEAVPPLPAERFRRLAGSGFAVLYAVTVCKPT
jgi:hypothetical protein